MSTLNSTTTKCAKFICCIKPYFFMNALDTSTFILHQNNCPFKYRSIIQETLAFRKIYHLYFICLNLLFCCLSLPSAVLMRTSVKVVDLLLGVKSSEIRLHRDKGKASIRRQEQKAQILFPQLFQTQDTSGCDYWKRQFSVLAPKRCVSKLFTAIRQ